jgi:hypothetical protein
MPSPTEEVEMSLLAGDEHASSREGPRDGDSEESELESGVHGDAEVKAPLTREDKKAMTLLIILCASPFSRSYVHDLTFELKIIFCR